MIPKPAFEGFILSWVPIEYHQRCINIYDSYGSDLSDTVSMIMIHLHKYEHIEEVLEKMEDFNKQHLSKQKNEVKGIHPLNITFLKSIYKILKIELNPPDYSRRIALSIPKNLIPTDPCNN